MSIAANVQKIQERIAQACARAGRASSDVRLVAVSKTKPVLACEDAFRSGQTIFGENYVQEALEKSASLPQAEWHLIGSLQTNKVRAIAGKFALIHSVDRERLVTELARASAATGVVQDILLQVHVGDEATKQGVAFAEAGRVIEAICAAPSLRLRGLMALPPLTGVEAEARSAFASVRDALERWRAEYRLGPEFRELSMGTTGDFEWAILEGATLVRVGTAIFGERERRV